MIEFRLREILRQRIESGAYTSETAFAHKIGARPNTINDICNNHIRRLPVDIADAICNELDVPLSRWMTHKKDA